MEDDGEAAQATADAAGLIIYAFRIGRLLHVRSAAVLTSTLCLHHLGRAPPAFLAAGASPTVFALALAFYPGLQSIQNPCLEYWVCVLLQQRRCRGKGWRGHGA